MNKKIAVVLFNLGGPDSPESVYGFLRNLFNDSAILNIPFPFRQILSYIIAKKRTPVAKEIYMQIGGSSPILSETKKQAEKLQNLLDQNCKVFISMRYWHPLSKETIYNVLKWKPDKILLVPLYPHFSTTTTGSSIDDWFKSSKKLFEGIPTRAICCYPTDKLFIDSHIALIKKEIDKINDIKNVKILFSAHGLPKSIIKKGDPYAWQVEQTVMAIVNDLAIKSDNWVLCYQSKVTPVEWLKPYTEQEIINAAKENKKIIIVPIAFVSEHSETLVELDKEYLELAKTNGIQTYIRVPALGIENTFIQSLAKMINLNIEYITNQFSIGSSTILKICPSYYSKCRNKRT